MYAKVGAEVYPKAIKKKKVKKRAKTKVHSEANAMFALKIMTVLAVFLFLVCSIVFLLGYADITSVRMEVNKLEDYRENLRKKNADLIAELEGIKSSTSIGEDAMYKLGMVYPDESQIVYISVSDEIVDSGRSVAGVKGIGKLFSFISGLF